METPAMCSVPGDTQAGKARRCVPPEAGTADSGSAPGSARLDKLDYDNDDPHARKLCEALWPLQDACLALLDAHRECPGCGFCEDADWLFALTDMAGTLIEGSLLHWPARSARSWASRERLALWARGGFLAEPYDGEDGRDPYARAVCEAIWPLQDAVRALRDAHEECDGCSFCWDARWLRVTLDVAAGMFEAKAPEPDVPEPCVTVPAARPPILASGRPQPRLPKRNYWEAD